MQSVSSQLEATLIIKSNHPPVRQFINTQPTGLKTNASDYLLKSDGLSKNRSVETNNYTPFNGQSTRKSASAVDPLLHQISESSVDKPKYWKSAGKQVKKVVKSQSQSSMKKRQQKGEEYNDRLKQKVENRKKKRA